MKKLTIIIAILFSIFLIHNNQEELLIIPNEAIRIRVIANSDDEKDIKIKEKVKDDLNRTVNNILKDVKGIDEAREKLENNMSLFTETVDKSLKEENIEEVFNINYGLNYFPSKMFQGVKYNEGYYESLVVTLGSGKGSNYWCVLYPPLCLIEENYENKEIEYRSYIKDILNKYF